MSYPSLYVVAFTVHPYRETQHMLAYANNAHFAKQRVIKWYAKRGITISPAGVYVDERRGKPRIIPRSSPILKRVDV